MMRSRLLRNPAALLSLAALLALGLVWAVLAIQANRPQTLDERTFAVAQQIQCPACTGQSIADSSTAVAVQMRGVVRQMLAEGKSEEQVLTYFRQRYGEGILESPPKQGFTLLIWVVPVLMLVAGGVLAATVAREWRAASLAAPPGLADGAPLEVPLPAEEERSLRLALRRALDEEEGLPPSVTGEGR